MQKIHPKPLFLRMIKLLNATNEYSRRHDYAWRHSNGRTESTKELHDAEILAIINELQVEYAISDPCDVMRKKIISKAHQMQWELRGGKIDMPRLNQWCTEQGPYKKELNKHDEKELRVLVSVFEKVYKHFMSKI